jgi:alkylation response protein AidB-like acyl-CoA dehydrogenase
VSGNKVSSLTPRLKFGACDLESHRKTAFMNLLNDHIINLHSRGGLDRALDFRFSKEEVLFRQQVREFFRLEVTPELLTELDRSREEHSRPFHLKLAQRGWIGMQWPTEVGGQGRSEIDAAVLLEEAGYFLAPITGYLVATIAGGTILHTGTGRQRDYHLPAIIRGESIFALGYTEPDAGSDLASLKTRAIPQGEGWRLRGSKIFTSLAHEANFMLVAARTNPDVPKHAGLTVFIVPTDRPGITVAPLHTLGGFRTNVVTLDDVPIERADVLGGVDDGWRTLGAALDLERTGASRLGLCRRLLDYMWQCVRGDLGKTYPGIYGELGEFERRWAVSRLLSYRAVWLVGQHQLPTAEAAMAKVVSTELAQDIASAAIRVIGPDSLVSRESTDGADGFIEHSYRNAARFTVTAGTSEIQRNIIAIRRLGLARA